MTSVIVFGPTGNVGSITARNAEKHGAKVWLAMRDTSKTIPGLSAEQEKTGRYERVSADLNKPDTLAAAVKTSGAKRAFIYLALGSSDHMKAALQALRSGGIEFVLFMSSFTIHGELRDIAPSEIIPYVHAQVEINLEEVFGIENFVALRPGAFATNLLRYKAGIMAGDVSIFAPHWEMDAVTPIDMGEVSGIILATGPRNGQHAVYVYGPQLIEQGNAIKRVGELLGKDVHITELDSQQALDHYAKQGTPKPFAEYMIRVSSLSKNEVNSHRVKYEEGVKNVETYTGRAPTSFEDWVKANTRRFSD